ncbi:CBASS cGAMP-activated phospholipase [Aminobacterium sp. MB27-C1]|jgi:patatin-like phospholipase/acyl hydrolase|uniref:CBASS cGAMP-activated phospholipase n=1 Tax=Aminobacterium sp. MB27-C1 TaxID=3070661 RepID=UPI0027DE187B|nr:CBASS cGAMP-activated phospholipase [Aminobacterium sp. MB27-C1]WMI72184.1 CBASS cGAMP-activated phospholipase [Aminobacterium sp. MB27-C1]
MSKIFRILSVDGGGIRGVYPAHILRCIEERLHINLYEIFDMITGTSTGSIIAAGVAIRLPVADIVEMYRKYGSKIFQKKKFFFSGRNLKKFCQPLVDSIYDSQYLEKILKEVCQGTCLGEIDKPLLIPSTDIGNGGVHVFKSGYSTDFNRDNNVLLKDAILASCSAPIFFDPHKIDHYLLADGGLWANNPALAAVIDAQRRLGAEKENIRVFSIGTGYSKTMYGTSKLRKWGFLNGWRHKKFIGFILSLQSQSAMNYLKLQLRSEQIKRIDFNSDTPLSLDDVSVIDDLISKADRDFTHESTSIRDFLQGGE